MRQRNIPHYVPADTGPTFWGPGDRYTFLVTGKESGGAYFMMEAIVPPGGGPPPHIHRREDESFYVLEGQLDIRLGEKSIHASAGDFVHIPRGTVHGFRNSGSRLARMLIIFAPSGMEHFFEETLEPALDRTACPPDNMEKVVARYIAAAPKYGLEFAQEGAGERQDSHEFLGV